MVSQNIQDSSSSIASEFLEELDNQIINKYCKTHGGQKNVQGTRPHGSM